MDGGRCGDFADRARIFTNFWPHPIPDQVLRSGNWCGGIPAMLCRRTGLIFGWTGLISYQLGYFPNDISHEYRVERAGIFP
jgi:hypothetical protein